MIEDAAQIVGHEEDDGSMDAIVAKLEDPSNKAAKLLGIDQCTRDIEKAILAYDLVKDKPPVWRGTEEAMLKSALQMCGVTEGKAGGRPPALEFVKNYGMGEEGYYQLLTKLVEFGKICKAAEILFGRVGRKSIYFPKAINYIVNSPVVDPKAKYTCGDAELETLLK